MPGAARVAPPWEEWTAGVAMDALLSIGIGLGLSAACGFRVFVPLLVASLAAQAGYLSLTPGFEWVGTQPALYAFGTATLLEILAYSIPGWTMRWTPSRRPRQ